MPSNSVMIHKLQKAINLTGKKKILYSTTQFYSEQQNRPVTMYIIKQACWDEEKKKNRNIELFSSMSQIQIVLFLRDLYYEITGKERPKNNPKWDEIRDKLAKKQMIEDNL